MYVLDASVILKWFLQERDSHLALDFKERYLAGEISIALPDLILYELANALRFNPNFKRKTVIDSLLAVIDLDIDITAPTPNLLKKSLDFAFDNNISVYDSIYISLASELHYQFVTADAKLYRKIKSLPFVKLLGS